MPSSGKKAINRVKNVYALIGAFTGAHIAAILIAFAFILFGAKPIAAEVDDGTRAYSPCWSKQECLNLSSPTDTTGVVTQPGQGECANGRCWCSSASCRDPRRPESNCPEGQGKCYSNPPPAPLVVSIGGARQVLDIGDYIAIVYNYGVTIAGIIAGMMFLVGGFRYLTAGGDAGKVTKAKERIKDSLVGLLLVFGAYVVLNTINPDILRLQMPKIPVVRRKLFVACQYFEMQKPCGERFLLVQVEGVPESAPVEQRYRPSAPGDTGGASTTECIGKSCSRAGGNDATQRCRIPAGTSSSSGVGGTDGAAAPPPEPAPNDCRGTATAPYACEACKTHNEACRGVGPSTECCGGFCVGGAIRSALGEVGAAGAAVSGGGTGLLEGHCGSGGNGQICGVDTECFSRHCANINDARFGGTCVSGREGSPCAEDSDCESPRKCVSRTGYHVCVTPNWDSPCDDESDCPGGLFCDRNDHLCRMHGTITLPPADPLTLILGGNGGTYDIGAEVTCESSANCTDLPPAAAAFAPMQCWTDPISTIITGDLCKPFEPGTDCKTGGDNECGTGGICYDGGITSASGEGLCTQGGYGEGCDNDSQCTRANSRCSVFTNLFVGWGGHNALCTMPGTEGMPCGIINTGTGEFMNTPNTCMPGLECNQAVYRCVRPPGCPTTPAEPASGPAPAP